ncbi:MAG: TonB-dependent receptor [Cellvibrionales bacterium]|nr:TonB-dependent receptor [Cellvibrionales bacterium]
MDNKTMAVKPSRKMKQLLLAGLSVSPLSVLAEEAEKKTTTEEVMVYGQAAALSSAINQTRQADGVVDVIDTQRMGDFPDQNISESLQRLPGISIQRDQGEGRYVSVRGLNPDYNSVSVNGINIPSPEADTRAVALDVIPNDLIGSVTVDKTITPDKDADALGGAIHIKSLSAYDREAFNYKVYVDASYNTLVDKVSPKLGLTFTDRLSFLGIEDALGVAFSSSYYHRDFGSDNVETGGSWQFDGGVIQGLEEVEQRDYTITRERLGFGLNLDLRYFDNTDLYLRTLYSQFTDDEERFANKIEFGEMALNDENEEAFDSKAIMAGETAQAVEMAKELKDREETQIIQSYAFGGESRIDDWRIDYRYGYSEAKEDEKMHIDGAEFKAVFGFDAGIGFSDSKKPQVFSATNINNPSNFAFDKIEMAEADVKDTQQVLNLNVAHNFSIAGMPSLVKFGTKVSLREKVAEETVSVYEEGDDNELPDNSLGAFVAEKPDYNLGNFGNGVSKDRLLEALPLLAQETDLEKSAIGDYTLQEDIMSVYAMMRMDIDDLRLITGVRYEGTDRSMTGKRFVKESESVTATQYETDDQHILPAIVAKYDLSEASVLRAAWTNTLARPTFEQLSPGALLNVEDEEGEAGNPLLETMTSSNIDVAYAWYPGDVSVVSVGVFYKQIEHFIYKTALESSILGFDEGLTMETWKNGDNASLMGMELNAAHQFNCGLLLSANATVIDSDATLEWYDEDKEVYQSREIRLPGQSDFVANLLVGYEYGRYSLRLSGNYQALMLDEVEDITDKYNDIYIDSNMHWDFVAKAKLMNELSATFKVSNLTDESYYAYQHKSDYNYQYEKYGRTFQLGFELANF